MTSSAVDRFPIPVRSAACYTIQTEWRGLSVRLSQWWVGDRWLMSRDARLLYTGIRKLSRY